MNARLSLLVALLALFVGLGAGYALSNLVSDGGGAAARGGTVAAPAHDRVQLDPVASRPKSDVKAAAPLADRGDAELSREDDAPRVTEAKFSRAREAITAPELPAVEGDATITGTTPD